MKDRVFFVFCALVLSIVMVFLLGSLTLIYSPTSVNAQENDCQDISNAISVLQATNTVLRTQLNYGEGTVLVPDDTVDSLPNTSSELEIDFATLEARVLNLEATVSALSGVPQAQDPCSELRSTVQHLGRENQALGEFATATQSALQPNENVLTPSSQPAMLTPTVAPLVTPTTDPNSLYFESFMGNTPQTGILLVDGSQIINEALHISTTQDPNYVILPAQFTEGFFMEFDVRSPNANGTDVKALVQFGTVSSVGDFASITIGNEVIEVYKTLGGSRNFVTQQYSFVDPTQNLYQYQHIGIQLQNGNLSVFVNENLIVVNQIDIMPNEIALGVYNAGGEIIFDNINVRRIR